MLYISCNTHRSRRRFFYGIVHLILSIICSISTVQSSEQHISVDVCDICRVMDLYIQNIGVDQYISNTCVADTCMKSNKFKMLYEQISVIFSDVTLENSQLLVRPNSDELSGALILSILGKFLVLPKKLDSHTFQNIIYNFQYDIATSTLDIKQPLCTFEKDIYSSLLILTVVVILFVLTLRVISMRNKFADKYTKVKSTSRSAAILEHSSYPLLNLKQNQRTWNA